MSTDRLPVELEALERIALDAERRAAQARDKADGRKPIAPGTGVQAWWKTEARRLEDLARRERERFDAALATHEAAQSNPEPF